MLGMALIYSPTTRGRLLALELRRTREDAQMEQLDAARALGWNKSKLSRIEATKTRPSENDVIALIELYGVSPERGTSFQQLLKESWKRGWWTAYEGAFTGGFLSLEDSASTITAWEVQLIPGLLQTQHYAEAVISGVRQDEESKSIHDRVTARMNRRRLLSRPDAPTYRAILDEGVLHRQVGGPDVMRDQLAHLLEQAQQPNVTIQIVPFSAGVHAGVEGPVVLFQFSEDADLDVAYAEGLGGDVYLESAAELRRIKVAVQRIGDAALSPQDSMGRIASLIQ